MRKESPPSFQEWDDAKEEQPLHPFWERPDDELNGEEGKKNGQDEELKKDGESEERRSKEYGESFNIITEYEGDLIKTKIEEILDLVKNGDVQTVIFLDKAARPIAWALEKVLHSVVYKDHKPRIRFINVGAEKDGSFETKDSDGAEKNIEQMPGFEELQSRWKDIQNKNVLIVDEFMASGESLKLAQKIVDQLSHPASIQTMAISHDSGGYSYSGTGLSWRRGEGVDIGALAKGFGIRKRNFELSDPVLSKQKREEGNTGVIDAYEQPENLLVEPNTKAFKEKQVGHLVDSVRKNIDVEQLDKFLENTRRFKDNFIIFSKDSEAFLNDALRREASASLDWHLQNVKDPADRRAYQWIKQASRRGFSLRSFPAQVEVVADHVSDLLRSQETLTQQDIKKLRNEMRDIFDEFLALQKLLEQYHEDRALLEKHLPNHDSHSKNQNGQDIYDRFRNWYKYFGNNKFFGEFFVVLNAFLMRQGLLPENKKKSLLLRKDMDKVAAETIEELKNGEMTRTSSVELDDKEKSDYTEAGNDDKDDELPAETI